MKLSMEMITLHIHVSVKVIINYVPQKPGSLAIDEFLKEIDDPLVSGKPSPMTAICSRTKMGSTIALSEFTKSWLVDRNSKIVHPSRVS